MSFWLPFIVWAQFKASERSPPGTDLQTREWGGGGGAGTTVLNWDIVPVKQGYLVTLDWDQPVWLVVCLSASHSTCARCNPESSGFHSPPRPFLG